MTRPDHLRASPRARRGEAGLVGKFVVVWLLIVALIGIVGVDAASILFTRFRLDDAAATAASTAATVYSNGRDLEAACAAAELSVRTADPAAVLGKGWCKIDTSSGEATITLRKTAKTVVVGRLSFTADMAKVVQRETAGPSAL
jgi:uncharacterized membrane protein